MLFACLYVPRRPDATADADADALVALARDFSPRIEVHAPHIVTLDVSGLRTLVGPPRTIGEELRTSAAARGLFVHVSVSASRAAAVVLAAARAGLTVIEAGGEARALAPLPLRALEPVVSFVIPTESPGKRSGDHCKGRGERSEARRRVGVGPVRNAGAPADKHPALECLKTFRRWGLKTIGDAAVLSASALFERTGPIGVAWHHLANGADPRPLVPALPDERFEETLALEWPIEGLEPLSFVLGRLFDPLCAHLEQCDRGVAVLHVRLRLVSRERYERRLELPAPIRDARALRTLALLDLESHPPGAAIDAVTVAADPTPGRVLQYSLLTRAVPSAERVSTLVARLTALMGENRIGSPCLVDSYRPGAFEMRPFTGGGLRASDLGLRASGSGLRIPDPGPRIPDSEPQFPAPGSRTPNPGLSASPQPRAPSPEPPAPRPPAAGTVQSVLRRFRHPIPARVAAEGGRPVRVTTDRRGFGGGRVESCAGPWRSSGEWWHHRPDAAGAGGWGLGTRDPGAGVGGPGAGRRTLDAVPLVAGSASRAADSALCSSGPGPRTPDPGPDPGWVSTQTNRLGVRGAIVPDPASTANDRESQADYIYALNFLVHETPASLLRTPAADERPLFAQAGAGKPPWNVDEWDVALTGGASYRLVRDRDTDRWYVSGVID